MTGTRKIRRRLDAALDARIGLLLRQRRLELGLSQVGLAAKLGLTFQQVQKYEKGVNQLAVARLLQICKVLRVPVRYFVGEPAVPGRNEAVDLKLERTLAKIRSRAVKRALLGLAKPLAGPAAVLSAPDQSRRGSRA